MSDGPYREGVGSEPACDPWLMRQWPFSEYKFGYALAIAWLVFVGFCAASVLVYALFLVTVNWSKHVALLLGVAITYVAGKVAIGPPQNKVRKSNDG